MDKTILNNDASSNDPKIPFTSTNISPQDTLDNNNNKDSVTIRDSSSDTSTEQDYKDKLDDNFCKIQDKIDQITDRQQDMIDKLKTNFNLIDKERKEEQWTSKDAIKLDLWKQKNETNEMTTPAEKLIVKSEQSHINNQVNLINQSSNLIGEAKKEIDDMKKDLNDLKDHRNTLTEIRLLEIKGIEGELTNEDEKKLDNLTSLESKQAKLDVSLEKENLLSKKRSLDQDAGEEPNKKPNLTDKVSQEDKQQASSSLVDYVLEKNEEDFNPIYGSDGDE